MAFEGATNAAEYRAALGLYRKLHRAGTLEVLEVGLAAAKRLGLDPQTGTALVPVLAGGARKVEVREGFVNRGKEIKVEVLK